MGVRSLLTLALLAVVLGQHPGVSGDPVLHRVRRLIGGTEVPEGRPWMGVLAYKNSALMDERPYLVTCGCVLIGDQFVLATAHCFDSRIVAPRDGSTLFVVLGLQDNSFGAVDHVQEFAIDGVNAQVNVHPDYEVDGIFFNDVAVIKLMTPAVMCPLVSALPLPPADVNDDRMRQCQFYGWGVTGESPITEDEFTQFLRVAPLKLQTRATCQTFYSFPNLPSLTDNHVCAARQGPNGGSPCLGDSGSPLICKFGNKDYVIGLNSFRRLGPCQFDAPQVYTRIANYLDFIQTQMSEWSPPDDLSESSSDTSESSSDTSESSSDGSESY